MSGFNWSNQPEKSDQPEDTDQTETLQFSLGNPDKAEDQTLTSAHLDSESPGRFNWGNPDKSEDQNVAQDNLDDSFWEGVQQNAQMNLDSIRGNLDKSKDQSVSAGKLDSKPSGRFSWGNTDKSKDRSVAPGNVESKSPGQWSWGNANTNELATRPLPETSKTATDPGYNWSNQPDKTSQSGTEAFNWGNINKSKDQNVAQDNLDDSFWRDVAKTAAFTAQSHLDSIWRNPDKSKDQSVSPGKLDSKPSGQFSWGNTDKYKDRSVAPDKVESKGPVFSWGRPDTSKTDPRWICGSWSGWQIRDWNSAPMKSLALNEREFLIADGINKLLKYDMRTDKLIPFLTLPPSCAIDEGEYKDWNHYTMQIDQENNRLFFLAVTEEKSGSNYQKQTSIIDIQSGSLIHQICTNEILRVTIDLVPGVMTQSCDAELCPTMLNVNGAMHKIGCPHTIWNESEMNWQPIKVKPAYFAVHKGISGVCLVHVPSKGIVLMIGGYDHASPSRALTTFMVSDQTDRSTGIWRYRVSSGLWEQMRDEQGNPLIVSKDANERVTQTALSADERYVIIAMNNKEPFKVLEIGDDDHYKLWDSSVNVPDQVDLMSKSGGRSGSKSLAFGWIRRNLASQFVPLAIKTLISHWCSVELIHSFATCVSSSGIDRQEADRLRSHQMIPLTDILCPKL